MNALKTGNFLFALSQGRDRDAYLAAVDSTVAQKNWDGISWMWKNTALSITDGEFHDRHDMAKQLRWHLSLMGGMPAAALVCWMMRQSAESAEWVEDALAGLPS